MTTGAVTSSKPSICIVAHFAYGVLSGGRSGHIGGVERQTTLLARWLSARDFRVTMITWDEGQPDDQQIDGIRVIKLCRSDAGIPVLRFVYPRWTSLVRALRKANADVYYQNCAEYVTGQVALWCERHGRGFVYTIANDPDCDPALPRMKKRYERELYRYGLTHADRVVVQTRKQKGMLLDGFGLDASFIPMPCEDAVDGEYTPPEPPGRGARILWVGRIATVKRLEWLLDMAEACPDLGFDVVGPPDGTDYVAGLIRRAARIPNVTFHGRVDPGDMHRLYRGKALLCCTSHWEGFPNTFLEAWSQGIPVVSTVDPDQRITELGLGRIGEGVDGLVECVRMLVDAPDCWRAASRAARRYFDENHKASAVLPRFERILVEAASCRTPA